MKHVLGCLTEKTKRSKQNKVRTLPLPCCVFRRENPPPPPFSNCGYKLFVTSWRYLFKVQIYSTFLWGVSARKCNKKITKKKRWAFAQCDNSNSHCNKIYSKKKRKRKKRRDKLLMKRLTMYTPETTPMITRSSQDTFFPSFYPLEACLCHHAYRGWGKLRRGVDGTQYCVLCCLKKLILLCFPFAGWRNCTRGG